MMMVMMMMMMKKKIEEMMMNKKKIEETCDHTKSKHDKHLLDGLKPPKQPPYKTLSQRSGSALFEEFITMGLGHIETKDHMYAYVVNGQAPRLLSPSPFCGLNPHSRDFCCSDVISTSLVLQSLQSPCSLDW